MQLFYHKNDDDVASMVLNRSNIEMEPVLHDVKRYTLFNDMHISTKKYRCYIKIKFFQVLHKFCLICLISFGVIPLSRWFFSKYPVTKLLTISPCDICSITDKNKIHVRVKLQWIYYNYLIYRK